jgi:signal peptidase I
VDLHRKFAIAGAAVTVLVLAALFTLKLYRIPSGAMEPTLRCTRGALGCTADESDRVIGLRYLRRKEPGRGDIVAFRIPDDGAAECGSPRGATFVKRVVALPGETWEMRNGFVYIDGRRLNEQYVAEDRRDLSARRQQRIPRDHYVVLGDNRSQSCDSQVWGPLPRENLIANIVFRYWPLDRLGTP